MTTLFSANSLRCALCNMLHKQTFDLLQRKKNKKKHVVFVKYKHKCMALLCCTLTFSCLCSIVLSIRCVGRCVRYTCWQTRSLCVRLSGSGCLTPPASPVWRQVREGTPLPCPLISNPVTLAVATAAERGNPDV